MNELVTVRPNGGWPGNSTMDLVSFLALKPLMREVTALGVKVRLQGAGVLFSGHETLPADLPARLEAARGLLWHWLGGDDLDEPALDLLDQLGVTAELVTTAAAARQAVRELERDKRGHGGVIAIDCETAPKPRLGEPLPWARINKDGGNAAVQPKVTDRSGLSPHLASIACLQLYAGGERCFVFRDAALDLVVQSHWLRRQRLVAHNAGFELAFLRAAAADYRAAPGRRSRFRLDCTAQAAGLIYGIGFGGEARALDAVAKTVLDLNLPKQLRVSDWAAPELSAGQIAYACGDAIVAWRLHPLLQRSLRQEGRIAAYELQRAALPAVADIELRGIRLDIAEHSRQTNHRAQQLAEARQEYADLTGRPPPSKPDEVRAWLESVLHPEQLAHWPRTPADNRLAVGAAQLKRLAHIESTHPVLRMLAAEKLLGNFGAKLAAQVNPVTSRIHAHYSIAGAKSGRFTCNHPNLQQLPSARAPEFRRCIVAAPGNLLVGCDYAQIELRAAAHVANDQNLTRVYQGGRDVHTETAAFVAGVPVDQVTRAQRQAAKAVNFGALYGQQAPGLVEYAFDAFDVVMSECEAQQALDRFTAAYPQLEQWKWDNYHRCRQRGHVLIGCGRAVKAEWEFERRIRFTQACNLPIQGIAADCMLRAVRLVHAQLLAAKIRGGLTATIHDELVAEVAEDDAERAREILQAAMIEAFETTFPGAPSAGVAIATIGDNWAELKL
jgi:DNA polymerase I